MNRDIITLHKKHNTTHIVSGELLDFGEDYYELKVQYINFERFAGTDHKVMAGDIVLFEIDVYEVKNDAIEDLLMESDNGKSV